MTAIKEGFLKRWRLSISLDGCHLKGSFDGMLLAVVSIDGNKRICPIAYVVVEVENKDS